MRDNIELVIFGVITGIVLAVILGLWNRRYLIAWRWKRWRANQNQRHSEKEQYLNQPVLLSTGKVVHRRCTTKEDEITDKEIIPLGPCQRCGKRWDERLLDRVVR